MLYKPYELMVAWRFLVQGKAQTALIILGIAVGVAIQVFMISLIGGLQSNMVRRTVGSSPHITVVPPLVAPCPLGVGGDTISDFQKPLNTEESEILSWQRYDEYLRQEGEITASAPTANGTGYIERGTSSFPVLVKGVTLPEADRIYKLSKVIKTGSLRLGGNNALIGQASSDKTGLKVGDKFFLRNQKGIGDYFFVQGVFDLGSSAANNMVVVSLDRGRTFLGLTGISSIEIQVKDPLNADVPAQQLKKIFSEVKVESWQEKNTELMSALKSQSSSSALIQFFVLLSITLGIASVLAITAIQKSRQLGILKAMGANDASAARIFILQGFTIGAAGAVAGILLGLVLAALYTFGAGRSGGLPFNLELTAANMVLPAVLAVVSATLAALVPARRAAALNPMEVIRNG